jgi:hypothetical protein
MLTAKGLLLWKLSMLSLRKATLFSSSNTDNTLVMSLDFPCCSLRRTRRVLTD